MARRIDQMSEQEIRKELDRRGRGGGRDPYRPDHDDGDWWAPDRHAQGAIPGLGYPWPVPPYPFPRHGVPDVSRRGDRFRGGSGGGREDRGFFDRASDEVSSWFGDEAAEARREQDHRGRGPKGYVRSDARIEEDVNDRLTDDPYVDASEVEVSVKDREVTLNGTVDSRQAKRAAEDCAEHVSGVVHVQNNLRVARPGA